MSQLCERERVRMVEDLGLPSSCDFYRILTVKEGEELVKKFNVLAQKFSTDGAECFDLKEAYLHMLRTTQFNKDNLPQHVSIPSLFVFNKLYDQYGK